MKIKIIGCGLIGTSMALKFKEKGHKIWLSDVDKRNLALAQDLIANSEAKPEIFDLIVIATPTSEIVNILKSLRGFNKNSTVIDIGGLKSKLLLEVEKFPELAKIYVSTHPMSGREVMGPQSARSDLFEGRAWLVTPTASTRQENIDRAIEVGKILGASCYVLSAKEHDSIIAAISHAPQILSSLMGALIAEEKSENLNFAGQGLRDVSRLAESDSKMWSELLVENRDHVVRKIKDSISFLTNLRDALDREDAKAVESFLRKGKEGRDKIPGKHGVKARAYSYLPIVINDKPGQLAKIFDECAACEVNVEDLSIEHSPNQETGLITLALTQSDAEKLKNHLQKKGWQAQEIR